MRCVARSVLAASLLTIPLSATPAATRRGALDDDAAAFQFEIGARAGLQVLWHMSVAAREERVACLGGYRDAAGVHITRVKILAPSSADSANVSAATSLAQCGTPEWFGTVHTHIALFQGRPFSTFSPADRWVMTAWRQAWHANGVFCVLYSETMSHCEAEGDASGDPAYAAMVGNRILP